MNLSPKSPQVGWPFCGASRDGAAMHFDVATLTRHPVFLVSGGTSSGLVGVVERLVIQQLQAQAQVWMADFGSIYAPLCRRLSGELHLLTHENVRGLQPSSASLSVYLTEPLYQERKAFTQSVATLMDHIESASTASSAPRRMVVLTEFWRYVNLSEAYIVRWASRLQAANTIVVLSSQSADDYQSGLWRDVTTEKILASQPVRDSSVLPLTSPQRALLSTLRSTRDVTEVVITLEDCPQVMRLVRDDDLISHRIFAR